jgi:transposase
MIPAGLTIYLATVPVDLRAGFDRLSGIVRERLKDDPRAGSLYVFTNRRRTHLKAIFYDRTGYCVVYKRLDRGTFPLPTVIAPGAASVAISSCELELLLRGLDLPARGVVRRKTTPTVH